MMDSGVDHLTFEGFVGNLVQAGFFLGAKFFSGRVYA